MTTLHPTPPRARALAALGGQAVFPIPCDVMENLIYPGIEGALCQHFGLETADHEGVLRALGSHTLGTSSLHRPAATGGADTAAIFFPEQEGDTQHLGQLEWHEHL